MSGAMSKKNAGANIWRDMDVENNPAGGLFLTGIFAEADLTGECGNHGGGGGGGGMTGQCGSVCSGSARAHCC